MAIQRMHVEQLSQTNFGRLCPAVVRDCADARGNVSVPLSLRGVLQTWSWLFTVFIGTFFFFACPLFVCPASRQQ